MSAAEAAEGFVLTARLIETPRPGYAATERARCDAWAAAVAWLLVRRLA